MKRPDPICKTAQKWVANQEGRNGLSKTSFAGFTGQDFPAYASFMHALELYSVSDHTGRENALLCMRYAVLAMQPKCRWIARESIPHCLDWGTRAELWPLILPPTIAEGGAQ